MAQMVSVWPNFQYKITWACKETEVKKSAFNFTRSASAPQRRHLVFRHFPDGFHDRKPDRNFGFKFSGNPGQRWGGQHRYQGCVPNHGVPGSGIITPNSLRIRTFSSSPGAKLAGNRPALWFARHLPSIWHYAQRPAPFFSRVQD